MKQNAATCKEASDYLMLHNITGLPLPYLHTGSNQILEVGLETRLEHHISPLLFLSSTTPKTTAQPLYQSLLRNKLCLKEGSTIILLRL